MEGVKLEEWKSNVAYAIDTTASKARCVSIGGLSTGGTLSFYKDLIFALDASDSATCLEKKNPKSQDRMEAITLFEKKSAASIF